MIKNNKNFIYFLCKLSIKILLLSTVIYFGKITYYELHDEGKLDYIINIPNYIKNTKFETKNIKNNELQISQLNLFVLKVGEYNDINDANHNIKNLLTNGYPAFIKKIKDNFVIFIGPEIDKEKLLVFKNELYTKYKIHGVIEDFDVNSNLENFMVVSLS